MSEPDSAGARTAAGGMILAAAAVLLGAFGAHALRGQIPPDRFEVFLTARQYHGFNALGLVALGVAMVVWPKAKLRSAAWLMGIGLIVFSGSLYLLAVTGVRWLGAVTPIPSSLQKRSISRSSSR